MGGRGLTHSHATVYGQHIPRVFKNADGDWFVGSYSPRDNNDPAHAVAYVEKCPAFDGPRGICDLNPYTTLVHGHKMLASGHMGWLGVGLDGRLIDVDITGEVTTFFGPRSVAGVVQTDPRLDMSLAERLDAGEKEFIGDPFGGTLKEPTDIWPDPTDDDLVWVADKGNGRVAGLSREQGKIVYSFDCEQVSSVWVCHDMRKKGVRICAVNPDGAHMFFMDGRSPAFTSIPNAQWIRGKQSDSDPLNSRTYIMTSSGAFYELNPNTGEMRMTVFPQTSAKLPSGGQMFSFFDIDTTGTIGPKGRIYFSWVNSPNSNTGIGMVDPNHDGPWTKPVLGYLHPRHGQLSPHIDAYGHYMWGFATHHHLPCFLTCGTAESTWLIHRAYTEQEVPNPIPGPDNPHAHPRWIKGRSLFTKGIKNKVAPLMYVFGREGGGQAGYGFDLFSYREESEAHEYMKPFKPDDLSDDDWACVVFYMWFTALKAHFP